MQTTGRLRSQNAKTPSRLHSPGRRQHGYLYRHRTNPQRPKRCPRIPPHQPPLDCPICDRGGECPLQNNTLAYGPSTSRFIEVKRHLPKAYPLSQYVTLDLERCIQCGRCVRFTEEISGDAQLAFRFRGAEMQPSTFQLTDFESKFSGNVIEICPVGALTSARYRFRARPWDLETKPGLCTVTPCGTNIWFDYRGSKFIRINGRTNEAVNEEWTADRCKFGHDFYNDPPASLRQTSE
ncbi:hypothetical protein CCB80_00360 [Armatimonadetes bacterium Uphvl-Ar1]|nr:hypothetical protein CCB80_00360 [Armatimonadetes bacterium Uphvl-Ar1]